jgi:hypothetical protein
MCGWLGQLGIKVICAPLIELFGLLLIGFVLGV